jgi:PAS domain-containing protein
MTSITVDVTPERHKQAELERQTIALREQAELLDLAHDAIVVRRLDGTITYWNRGAERSTGTPGRGARQATATALRTRARGRPTSSARPELLASDATGRAS